jgi:HD-GYP domain-containing protein (c-di-GMP phosphodiesterase class II)
MGMAGSELDGLRFAALIHDVGKISVPAEILSKPGRLSENEFDLIRGHAQAGHDVLQSIAFEQPVAEMVLQHHERLDGSGYPNGLGGDEILREARVMAVADVYEAMTSHRPYRPGLPVEAAVAELRDGAGVRYDPRAVEACLQTLDDGFAFTNV